MTTSPYSLDLRNKLISYLCTGKSQYSASKLFGLSPSTVSRWWLRYKREGTCNARTRLGKKPRVTYEEILEYIKSHPNFRLSDLGDRFNMTASGALYWLKKMNYSYKKKTSPTWRQMKKSAKNTKKQ